MGNTQNQPSKQSTGIFYLKSTNLITESCDKNNQRIIEELIEKSNGQIIRANKEDLDTYKKLFVFVSGGGTESIFKEHLDNFDGMIYLIATNSNNSLAASMEILSYLNNNNRPGKIIHSKNNVFTDEVLKLLRIDHTSRYLKNAKFARIGKPSDWLISSDVDEKALQKSVGTQIIDIPIDELITEINLATYEEDQYTEMFNKLEFNSNEKTKALNVYGALKRTVNKYQLNGITVRCFDLLDSVKTTSCVAFALLNAQGIYSSCEGDTPSLISMALISELTGHPPFQANPSVIDSDSNMIVLAHCTLPFNMPTKTTLDTHFESGIGVALKSHIQEGSATIFKTSGMLDKYFASNATIIRNLNRDDLCRTQIEVRPDKSVEYFFNNSIGNHHIVVTGKHEDLINEFFTTKFPESQNVG